MAPPRGAPFPPLPSFSTRRSVAAAIAALTVGGTAGADFHAGVEAYHRGDYERAMELWLPLAEEGRPEAQANVGTLYWRGLGTDQDFERALHWFRHAANQGSAIAQDSLGQMYYRGEGVPRDGEKAVRWIRRAALQGDAPSQLRLGGLYSEGSGVDRDPAKAVEWWRKSAEQGNANAALRLGMAYETGFGVEADPDRAAHWYDRVERAGDDEGARGLVVVQLAALRSEERARSEWERIQRRHPELLGGFAPRFVRADLGARGTYYRVQIGSLPDRPSAEALCEKLLARAQGCLVR